MDSISKSEKPQHLVTVPSFFMGKYPIIQEQWEVIAALPKVNIDLDPNPSKFKGTNLPVEQVSWFDVEEFCARLSRLTNKNYRTPSEAEWEYACRAETTTPFHFGKTIVTYLANYRGDPNHPVKFERKYREQTTEIDKFPPNAFGLYDMHGNVWEWCADSWHNNYYNAPTDGSPWLDHKGDYQLLRGGSWYNSAWGCRSACRGWRMPKERYPYIGFRVACSLPLIPNP